MLSLQLCWRNPGVLHMRKISQNVSTARSIPKETFHVDRHQEPDPEHMGMPIPRSFYTQVSPESPLWDDPSGLERRVAPVNEAEGVGHERRRSDARSRAYAHLHSTQIQCGKPIGFSERKELDRGGSEYCQQAAQLC